MNSSQSSQFHYKNRDLITEIAKSYVGHVISAADSMSGLTHTAAAHTRRLDLPRGACWCTPNTKRCLLKRWVGIQEVTTGQMQPCHSRTCMWCGPQSKHTNATTWLPWEEFWARPWSWETPPHQPFRMEPCLPAQLSAPGVSRAWQKTVHAPNTDMRHPATRPAGDVKPPQKVRNCTICLHMPLPVRATLTGVTMRSTRRNSVCNQDWINNANPCTPPCCVCGLWSTDRSVCSVCDLIDAGENKISLQKYTFHYRANNMIHYIRWQFITEGKKFHYRKYWLSCQRKVIHYENLNSLQKFEFITEEHKSITGE